MMYNTKTVAIVEYQPWMLDQIIELNIEQYGSDIETYKSYFEKLASAPYVIGKSIPLVALDNNNVVGVQTYRYWPYTYKGKSYYSLQSGGTLVRSTHRGQGLFMRLLASGNRLLKSLNIDFVMGFPVKMSFGGFVKDEWIHLCSPKWFVKLIRPVRLVLQKAHVIKSENTIVSPSCFEHDYIPSSNMKRHLSSTTISLSTDPDFLVYRYGTSKSGQYLYWNHYKDGSNLLIVCKWYSNHGYSEIIVGDVLTDSDDTVFISNGYRRFLEDVKKGTSASAVSMLIGGGTLKWLPLLLGNGFVGLPKGIHMIFKNISLDAITKRLFESRSKWSVLGSDLDTW